MKKFLVVLFFVFMSFSFVKAADFDCETLYEKAELFPSKLYNDIDPFQDEDTIKYAWSPYPLFRTSADLYFKNIKIEPGYYLLTPRNLNGKDYVLFKQNGKVQHIVPVVQKGSTPLNFYAANTPQVKMTKWQTFATKVRKKFYDTATDAGRATPPGTLVDVEVEIEYLIVYLYYGDDKYTMVFKRSPY